MGLFCLRYLAARECRLSGRIVFGHGDCQKKDGGMWQNIQDVIYSLQRKGGWSYSSYSNIMVSGVIIGRLTWRRRKEDKRMFRIFVNVVLNFNLNICYLLF